MAFNYGETYIWYSEEWERKYANACFEMDALTRHIEEDGL